MGNTITDSVESANSGKKISDFLSALINQCDLLCEGHSCIVKRAEIRILGLQILGEEVLDEKVCPKNPAYRAGVLCPTTVQFFKVCISSLNGLLAATKQPNNMTGYAVGRIRLRGLWPSRANQTRWRELNWQPRLSLIQRSSAF